MHKRKRKVKKKMKVISINSFETYDILKNMHYAKRIPNIMFSYGLYEQNNLEGIITYGIPVSRALCVGVCGKEFQDDVLELNRLFLFNNKKNQASMLVAKSLKLLPKPKIVVSYADTSMNHNGYIYQATNFIYTGLSAKRKEWQMINSKKHSRTITGQHTLKEMQDSDDFIFVNRPRKHRYIYFIGSKKQKKQYLKKLKYPTQIYPKNQNKKYEINYKTQTQELLF